MGGGQIVKVKNPTRDSKTQARPKMHEVKKVGHYWLRIDLAIQTGNGPAN
jgi:hypothetical protein